MCFHAGHEDLSVPFRTAGVMCDGRPQRSAITCFPIIPLVFSNIFQYESSLSYYYTCFHNYTCSHSYTCAALNYTHVFSCLHMCSHNYTCTLISTIKRILYYATCVFINKHIVSLYMYLMCSHDVPTITYVFLILYMYSCVLPW